MELSQVRYFLEVADTLNYTKAAERCLISRQAMRQSLRALESEIGAPLIANERNHLSLTEVGTAFEREIRPAINQFDEAARRTKALASAHATIRIAYPSTLFPFLFPRIRSILASFAHTYPGTIIEESMPDTGSVAQVLASGEYDLVLDMVMFPKKDCPGLAIASWEIGITMSANNPLGARKTLSLQDIAGMRLAGCGDAAAALAKAAKSQGIALRCENAPDVISALHAAAHEKIGFIDVISESMQRPDLGLCTVTVPLAGYRCELRVFTSEQSPNPEHAKLLRDYIASRSGADDAPRRPNPTSPSPQ